MSVMSDGKFIDIIISMIVFTSIGLIGFAIGVGVGLKDGRDEVLNNKVECVQLIDERWECAYVKDTE